MDKLKLRFNMRVSWVQNALIRHTTEMKHFNDLFKNKPFPRLDHQPQAQPQIVPQPHVQPQPEQQYQAARAPAPPVEEKEPVQEAKPTVAEAELISFDWNNQIIQF